MNAANNETRRFIEDTQRILSDLYSRWTSIYDPGMIYHCPFDSFMDMARDVNLYDVDDLINEDAVLFD